MIRIFIHSAFFIFLTGIIFNGNAQGFLRADGKKIVNGQGQNIILRGIGTGNWMLMEGYMMKTEGVAGTQHEIKSKLEELMGKDKTNEFFSYWLDNHFTKADVDSMKAWGFNSVRVAMHYKWFTLPVEEELIPGNNTWVLKGFKLIDNLLDWCKTNQMYLILDLHGAPGGQGKNADISDYDPKKPSLWESQANKDKTVALWKQIATRYSNEPWIGGYDLINETNWTFPEGNNTQLRQLLVRITEAIRQVDKNRIIFIEGNNFANDFSGLTPPWDNNLVYSFHKYWSGTTANDLDWVLKLRNEHNVPLWLGESGENSNTWHTELITTCEKNNIGWSWWPVKKNGINNPLFVTLNKEYEDLVKYWKGEITTKPSGIQTFNAVKQWADNHKIANCRVQYDVIDAMIRQPHTNETRPYRQCRITGPVFFSEFDFGKNGIAYSDKDFGHYGGAWSAWNTGWGQRNDGVDIETCNDPGNVSNGYNVGWTEDGEWMQYSVKADSTALYTLNIRHASGTGGSKFKIEANGVELTTERSLPGTGGWQNWQTANFENILIPAGNIKLKYLIIKGGSNLSNFKFLNPKSASSVQFQAASASTSDDGFRIYVNLNKDITSSDGEMSANDFSVKANGNQITVLSVKKDPSTSNVLILEHKSTLYSINGITVTYSGASVKSKTQELQAFSNLSVKNNLPLIHGIPGKIEAEAFEVNAGFSLENCSDVNGGKNTAYASPGDYLDYRVHVTKSGMYSLNYRLSTLYSNSQVIFQVGDGINFTSADTLAISSTGGWQNWRTQTSSLVYLKEGFQFIRILVKQGEHNLNWFQLDFITGSKSIRKDTGFRYYPNPAKDQLVVRVEDYLPATSLKILNSTGKLVRYAMVEGSQTVIDISGLKNGMYLLLIENGEQSATGKFIISN